MLPLLRITGRDQRGGLFCAGIERDGPYAPILRRRLKGKTLRQIRDYCKERDWELELWDGFTWSVLEQSRELADPLRL